MRKILFSVFEKSADFYAARLIPYLDGRWDVFGFGGSEMKTVCRRIRNNVNRASVMGISDLFFRFPFFVKLLFQIRKSISSADALVLIDFAGLNLKLLQWAEVRKIPVIYFIPPKFWAWKPERSERLRSCRAVFPLFPFEHEMLIEAGVSSFYYGHPLYEELRQVKISAPVDGRIGIFPGSRSAEIESTLPLILKTLKSENGEFFLFLADESVEFFRRISTIVSESGLKISFVRPSEKHQMMSTLSRAVACSGTVSLELSFFAVPTVVVYKTSWISYAYFKKRVNLRYYALPNILAGKEIYPELIQGDFNENNLKDRLNSISVNTGLKKDCTDIWNSLAGNDIYRQISEKIGELLK